MKIILICIGIVFCLLYLIPLLRSKLNIGNILGIITGIMYILLGVFLDKLKLAFQTDLGKIVTISSICIVGIFYILFFVTLFKIVFHSKKTATNEKTVIILGCRVKGVVPSLALEQRCKSAYLHLAKNPNSIAILSGGQGRDEDISEAMCMKLVLEEMGIKSDRLFLEDKSKSTKENLMFSKEIIEKNNLSNKIALSTSEYHIYRASKLAKNYDMEVKTLPSKSRKFYRIPEYTREVLANWYMILSR